VHRRVTVEVGSTQIEGSLQNLSREGAQVHLKHGLGGAKSVLLRLLRYESDGQISAQAMPVWEREDKARGGWFVGLKFMRVSPDDQKLIDSLALWDFRQGEDGTLAITLHGELNEQSDLGELGRFLAQGGRVQFDMSHLRYINSWGVRKWSNFLKGLPASIEYRFVRVSVPFVLQASMVSGIMGRGMIESCFAPFHCETCDRTDQRLLQCAPLVLEGRIQLPNFRCGVCGGVTELEDVPERYFAFLVK
jgi:hypothetical protein